MNYPKIRYTGEKPWMDRDWLYNEYIIKDRSTKDIADEYGCKRNTIQCWLLKFGIKKPIHTHQREYNDTYQNKDWLYHQHIELHKSISEIARECGISDDNVKYFLDKFGIESWRTYVPAEYTEEVKKDIIDLYLNKKWSANQIGMKYNTSGSYILTKLKSWNINTRPSQVAHRDIENGAEDTITWNHSLTALVRNYFANHLRTLAIRRDGTKCMECGSTEELQVHHIVPESSIIATILKEHPDLNPNDEADKLTLYNIIIKDSRFLDLSNLITLCRKCHKAKHRVNKDIYEDLEDDLRELLDFTDIDIGGLTNEDKD